MLTKNWKCLAVLCALTLSLTAAPAGAAIIAQYDLAVGADTNSDPVDVEGANTTAGDFQVFRVGVLSTIVAEGNQGAGISSSAGDAFIDRSMTDTTITASTDDYFTFSVTPDGGFDFDFTNITLDYSMTGTSGIPYTYELRSDIDAFGSILDTFTHPGAPAATSRNVDLTSLAIQSSAVEFRFFFKDGDNGPDRAHRIDNVVLNGTVSTPVPEPSTLILLSTGLLGLLASGRRRKRRRA